MFLGGDVTGGRPARGGYNLASLEGAVPGMEFGGRTALGGGPVPFSLQDSRSALPAESLASVFGGPLGGVQTTDANVLTGYPIRSDFATAQSLGFPRRRPMQSLRQLVLPEPPVPYELPSAFSQGYYPPDVSQGIQQSRSPWQNFSGCTSSVWGDKICI